MIASSAEFRTLLELVCPPGQGPPDFEELEARYSWVQDMAACPQPLVEHGEGDVWTHTRMVMEAMQEAEEWQRLPSSQRDILILAALFHDVGKPGRFFGRRGQVRPLSHSRQGEILTRRILWEMEAPLEVRESVAQLVRFHQEVSRLPESKRPDRAVREMSWCVRPDLLWLLATANARGRVSPDRDELMTAVALFRGAAEEAGCFLRPYPFPSDQSRMEWVRSPQRNPLYPAHDDPRCEMVLLCGLPGSGKSYWAWEQFPNLPVEGYDRVRRLLELRNEGRVRQEGRERIRVRLRAGESFVFESDALSRDHRSRLVGLAMDYGARVRVVHVEATPEVRAGWNLKREEAVPVDAFLRMLDRWEFPAALEGHRVEALVHRNADGQCPLTHSVKPWGWDGEQGVRRGDLPAYLEERP